ncbi:4-(cytidine 5'-diphospho)-2-C-methyl-D-erythritol kinase [Alkalimonas collagenimarina]|uniref:4-diphosphocytidyl-2-C-methyl-D-erythritol kinase n=1 Tax=Alkalimonas collagenimarina TaxID=400390 RepID=A0ABT9GWZ4_9GAMM|nr:4-(cytidine 5'-diphospho)-2-C-methyl-D-erythritol kinase [Alkalimonas collagenimarina]MDP4535543.1 4-(cytidine 5'-diphospho)-2-C-methyl-D-erythritol kinase [Alkalimonas collagenimarina]
MNTSITLPAVAKLNLFLHITGRRADGYHNLQSIFQMLDYGDELTFTRKDTSELCLRCNQTELESQDNLVLRAARLLQQQSQTSFGADIYLHKRLPLGGGLGGGSSDAATTLLALNQLWGLHLSIEQLAQLGLQLGADVPVFVHGRTAFAEGVGEQLTPIELPERWYLVVTPDCHVSTAEIFQHPALPRNSAPLRYDQLKTAEWRNDCQSLVEQLYPNVALTLQWLLEYAPSRMTGTGASVFAGFTDKMQAEKALSTMPSFCRGFIARGVSESPVVAALAKAHVSSQGVAPAAP